MERTIVQYFYVNGGLYTRKENEAKSEETIFVVIKGYVPNIATIQEFKEAGAYVFKDKYEAGRKLVELNFPEPLEFD